MLKQMTCIVSGLALSSFAYAGTMGPVCTPSSATVPCEASLWDIGVQALYLHPVYSSKNAYQSTATAPYRSTMGDSGWGYRLEGSYHFKTGNDLTATWVHYDQSDDMGVVKGSYYYLAALSPLADSTLTKKNQFDQLNLVFAQHVDFGLFKDIRYYAGLQYAAVKTDDLSVFNVPGVNIIPAIQGISTYVQNDFKGAGPTFGSDFAYNITDEFSLTANAAGSILYGKSRYAAGTSYLSGVNPYTIYASKHAIIPSLEAKLGAKYTRAMSQGVLNIEGGYQAMNYFNVLQAQYDSSVLGGTRMVNSDFGLYGPYVGVKWIGNA